MFVINVVEEASVCDQMKEGATSLRRSLALASAIQKVI